MDLAALGIHPGHDVLDGAVFPRRIHTLQNQQNRPAILGIEFLLQFLKARDAALQYFFRVIFRFQPERFSRIEIFHPESRSVLNPKWADKLASIHGYAISFFPTLSARFTSACAGAG